MRWQPTEATCSECGFEWSGERSSGIETVARAHADAAAALAGVADPTLASEGRWSPAMYVWHLVDVLRIGSERLLTLSLDRERGIPCWDENLLAEARRYAALSPIVGLAALRTAADQWLALACDAADAEIDHPVFGTLTTLDVIRRNAHEVRHHLRDMRRSDGGRG